MAVKKEKQVRKPMTFKRRVLSKVDYCVPEQSLSLRVLIDRVSKGLPVNAQLSKHVPLPPDGEDMKDFDTGTEEILDVSDAVEHVDALKSQLNKVKEQQQKIAEEKQSQTAPETAPPANVG